MMRNERKLEILNYLSGSGACTARGVATALNIKTHNAKMLLLRYHRQGLLSRRTIRPFEAKEYNISEKGVRRLEWLGGQ